MEDFIMQHPGVIIGLLSVLTTVVSSLLVLLLGMVKGAVARFEESVTVAINALRKDLFENRTSIGRLLDRMQRQETICEMRGRLCPGAHACKIAEEDLLQHRKESDG